jgi:EH domain-containing protein 1
VRHAEHRGRRGDAGGAAFWYGASQYSTGKTTFIKHLLNREYPGAHIGPEPTTDRFVVVMGGVEERRTPGNTLVVQSDKPFTGLTKFGTAFLSKFECAQCNNELLNEVCMCVCMRGV